MKYSIIIPCYNEEKNLSALVSRLNQFPEQYDVEFILVENGSKDNSREYFKKNIESCYSRIKAAYVDVNQGYGYGIKQGILSAEGDYLGWIHADLQLAPEYLADFFDYIQTKENENVLMKGRRYNRHILEYFFTFGMGCFETILFRSKMKDVMSMPVIFNRTLLDDVSIDDIPNDFSIDIFTYVLAKKKYFSVVHLPVKMKDREHGNSSWNTGILSRIKVSKKMIDASIYLKKHYFK